jgi:hypothetical protein
MKRLKPTAFEGELWTRYVEYVAGEIFAAKTVIAGMMLTKSKGIVMDQCTMTLVLS